MRQENDLTVYASAKLQTEKTGADKKKKQQQQQQQQNKKKTVHASAICSSHRMPNRCVKCKLFVIYEPSHGRTNNVVSEQVRHKSGCTVTEAG